MTDIDDDYDASAGKHSQPGSSTNGAGVQRISSLAGVHTGHLYRLALL